MSRIKAKRQGVNNMLVFTNEDNNTGTITFNGSVFTFSAPTTFSGAQQLLPDGTAAAPSLAFSNSTGVGLYRYGSNVLGFSTAGSMRMILTAGGVLTLGTILINSIGSTITGDKKSIVEGTGAAYPLTSADSGKVFFFDGTTGATAFTLPAPAAGLTYKFIWTANNNNAITIQTADLTDGTGDLFVGGLLICAAAAVNNILEAGATVNTLTIDDNAANVAGGIGSWIEITCIEDPLWAVTGVLNSTSDNDSTGAQFTHV